MSCPRKGFQFSGDTKPVGMQQQEEQEERRGGSGVSCTFCGLAVGPSRLVLAGVALDMQNRDSKLAIASSTTPSADDRSLIRKTNTMIWAHSELHLLRPWSGFGSSGLPPKESVIEAQK